MLDRFLFVNWLIQFQGATNWSTILYQGSNLYFLDSSINQFSLFPFSSFFAAVPAILKPGAAIAWFTREKGLKHFLSFKKKMLLCLVDLDQEELLHLLQLRCLLPRPLSLLVGNLQHFSLVHIFKKKQIFDWPQFSTSGSYSTWQSCWQQWEWEGSGWKPQRGRKNRQPGICPW